MRKKLDNKYGLSLPFIVVVLVAVFLSGCNLNTGGATPATHEPEAMRNTKPVEVGKTSYVSYKAGAIQAFDQQKFDAAMTDGKTIFLDFFAPWCPTCRANKSIVEAAFDGGTDVVGFRVDYDTATALRKKYSVISQSTYIVLGDGQELDRYLGSLTSEKMAALLSH